MKFNREFKSFDLDNNIPMLMYVEHNGNESILHMIVWPDGIGSTDLTITGPAEGLDCVFQYTGKEGAQSIFDQEMKPLLETLTDG